MSGANGSYDGYNLFVYCFNDPVNMTDGEGTWSEKNEEVFGAIGEFVKDVAYSVYYHATAWHFEKREEKNGEHPTYEEVKADNSGWILLPGNQSIYHDNGVGESEEKYIHPDGREAVFDGDTYMPITDPRYIATYNYCPIYEITGNEKNILDYLKVGATYAGHFFADMLPYYATGFSNTREQFESKISIFG